MTQRRKRGSAELRAEREVLALKLRQGGRTYLEIGAELGCSAPTALRCVQKSLGRLAKQNTAETQGLLALELARLDALSVEAYKVLEAEHPLTSGGAVVEHGGQVLTDHGPVLRAIDRLLKISERRCALLGLNAPERETGAGDIIGALAAFALRAPV